MLLAVNGVKTSPEEAQVSVFDRGFLFGDAIYDVVATHGGRLYQLEEHLDRLEGSGEAVGLDVKSLRPELERTIGELLDASEHQGDVAVRIMITRGSCPDLDLQTVDGPPMRIVWLKPLKGFSPLASSSIRLISVRPEAVVARIAPGVKSNNRQANVMASRMAYEVGADDGLFVDPAGNVTEGPTWNVFCVKDGNVATPPLEGGILRGITRGLVLELCQELGIPHEERAIPLAEAQSADEIFVTSTTRGVMAVAQLDESKLPAPGPVTARLGRALGERMAAG